MLAIPLYQILRPRRVVYTTILVCFYYGISQILSPISLLAQVNRILTTPTSPPPVQNSPPASSQLFFMDALFFKDETNDSLRRVDIFTLVPYQSLQFLKRDTVFIADYIATLTLKDQNGKTVQTIRKERPIKEERIEVTLGATGAYDYLQTTFRVPPGTYTAYAEITDVLSKRSMILQSSFKALTSSGVQFALSSVMYVSSIQQHGNRYTITPYLSEDISALTQDGLYVFFETYNSFGPELDSLDFAYEIIDSTGKQIFLSKRQRRYVAAPREQQILSITLPPQLPIGSYNMRILALRLDTTSTVSERDILAASTRTMRLQWKGLGLLAMLKGDDLMRAIRQMRYVATPQEISLIAGQPTEEERQRRFFEYWQRLDPTPGTLRNEAFEEYYQRIEYANRNFRAISFGDGWMSDMGMVYTIFGPPQFTRDFRRDGRIIWTWVYPQYGREFVFVDYTGFGNDFRLASGMPLERYRYRR